MRIVMVMFDSLNRKMLQPYGCDWTKTPNFQRLAQRTVTFDKSWVCSMPCMPARRDLLTGRPSFLHRGWGPIEPFDDTFPEILRNAGIQSHLITDHYHYFEDGGATYHGRYDSWRASRGQEGDPHIGQIKDPVAPPNINPNQRRSDWVNRQFLKTDQDYPQTQTFNDGLDFIHRNHDQQNFFLQIECFDPHEPFVSPQRFKDGYEDAHHGDNEGPLFDWPAYRGVTETPQQVAQCRGNYAALLTMCDESLGRVLDAFDRYDMWKDTMLIVWTDHGFMLGEHDMWAKSWQPLYEEISHTPFFIYDPRNPTAAGQRRSALVQPSIDLAPTILDFFGLAPAPHMTGHALTPVISHDTPVRQAAIFGYHNHQHMNVTDGRHVYLHTSANLGPLNDYTLHTTVMRGFLSHEALRQATLHPPLPFTKGLPVLRIPLSTAAGPDPARKPSMLFDIEADPGQHHPLDDPATRDRLIAHAVRIMHHAHAPAELYHRLGFPASV